MGIQETNIKSALLVGTARNASKYLAEDLSRILNALEEIMPCMAFVVESDSQDNTTDVLNELARNDSRVRFTSLGTVESEIPERIARLRHCRNIYVDEIRKNVRYRDCDIIVVADLDGINTKINTHYFEVALATKSDWDVLAANQSARYYDILALRHPLWSPNNWILEAAWFKQFLGEKGALRHSMADRMIRIPQDLEPIPVDSAFGGLAIYRKWVFDKCDYSEDSPDSATENEHVTFHRKIRSLGARIFIHPGLINAHWTVYSLDGSPSIRLLKSLSKTWPLSLLLPALRKTTLFAAK